MGANASTAVPLYASGQVLDAARLNLTNSGIPVFSGTATRDAAFGGSGEKVLAEGQFAYLEDTNAVQYYDSAAWQSVGTTPGLTFITGASFTTSSAISLPASTFTSTYQNYLIVGHFFPIATGNFSIRMRASGADETGSVYLNTGSGRVVSNEAVTINQSSTTSALLAHQGDTAAGIQPFILNVFSPQIATRTGWSWTCTTAKSDFASIGVWNGGGQIVNATVYDALSFISSGASALTGNYKVYGYQNS